MGYINRKLKRHNRGMLLVVADKGFGMMVETSGWRLVWEGRGTFDVGWRCVFVSRYVGAAEEGFSAELSALCKTNALMNEEYFWVSKISITGVAVYRFEWWVRIELKPPLPPPMLNVPAWPVVQ